MGQDSAPDQREHDQAQPGKPQGPVRLLGAMLLRQYYGSISTCRRTESEKIRRPYLVRMEFFVDNMEHQTA